MTRLVIVALLFTTFSGHAQQWVVDSSSVSFKIRNAGIVVNGTFKGLEAELNFNPKKLKGSSITATVDAATVDTGIRIRNNHLRKSDYFDATAYPTITIKSVSFEKKKDGRFIGEFTLTMKDREGTVALPFTFEQHSPYWLFQGTFSLNRRDFGIGGKSIILADDVSVDLWVRVTEGAGGTGGK